MVVLGWEVADKLFEGADPLGKSVRIKDLPFTVIGRAKEQGSVLGQSQDNMVVIPITTYGKLFGSQQSISIPIEVASTEVLPLAMDEARVVMRVRHQLRPRQEDDFAVETSASVTGFWKQLSATIFGADLQTAGRPAAGTGT